jgi:transglutaminase-like putative cysteine protease
MPARFVAFAIMCLCMLAPAINASAAPRTAATAKALVPGPGDVTVDIASPGCCPTGMAWDGKVMWVADRKSNLIFQVDPFTGTVVRELPTPGLHPAGIAINGVHMWIADSDRDMLFRMDSTTGIVDRAVRLSVKAPRGMVHDGRNLFLADARDNRIYLLDPDDATIVRSFPAPGKSITGLAWDGKHLWAADRGLDEIHRIDPEHGEVLGVMKSPGPHPYGLAWDGRTLWCADYQNRRIQRIHVAAGRNAQKSDEKALHIEYSLSFQVQGPDPLLTADVFLAIPQSRPNQKILGKPRFVPEPDEILTDRWGQAVARFQRKDLAPGARFEPRIIVDAILYRTRFWVNPDDVGRLDDIPREIRERYLVDGRKYRLFDPFIQKAAREAVGDEKNPYWMARRIYRYVMDHMTYSLEGGWDTAPEVLRRGSGSCSEYSFAFIALCRAVGIPARYLGGIVTRGDDAFVDNVFHRWTEIWLPGYGWIPIDADRGDKPTTRGQALGFAYQENTLLVTTEGGGESEYLDWKYNGNLRWTFKGHTDVRIEQLGELSPLDVVRENATEAP